MMNKLINNVEVKSNSSRMDENIKKKKLINCIE